jgi:anti-sigma regulatory factor (Ser/Thr protein kinase)
VTSADVERARWRATEAQARAERRRRDAGLSLSNHAAKAALVAQFWDSVGRLDLAAAHVTRALKFEAAAASYDSQARDRGTGDPSTSTELGSRSAHHDGVLFGSEQELVEAATPWLAEASAAGDLVVLGCTAAVNRAVVDAFGRPGGISYLPTAVMYKNAVTTIDYLRRFSRRQLSSGASGVRLLIQPDFGDGPLSWDEWRQFEAICNRAWRNQPVRMLCAYDTRVVPDAVLGTAELTHPHLLRDGAREANWCFVEPSELLRLTGPEPDVREVDPALWIKDVRTLHGMRQRLRDLLDRGHIRAEVSAEFVQVVNELASNGVLHGAPPVSVRVWLFPDRLVCAVTDQGAGFAGPLDPVEYDVGSSPGPGLGLHLARHLCDDAVAIRNEEGFTVRVVKNLWAP